MLKFLRKYSTWILVIGGAFLMVAFLLPQAIEQIGADPTRRTILRVAGESINERDRIRYANEYDMLDSILRAPDPQTGNLTGLLKAMGITSAEHYMLLAIEARRGGFVGGAADGAAFVPELGEFALNLWQLQLGQQFFGLSADEFINAIEQSRIRGGRALDEALADLRGITRLSQAHVRAPRFAANRAVVAAQRQRDEATASYVEIPASLTFDRVPEPTDEELEALFERFRSTRTGTGEFGIGYTLAPRAKVAWIEISRDAIRDRVRVDPIERQARLLDAEPLETETREEMRERITAELRNSKAEQLVGEFERAIVAEMTLATRGIESLAGELRLPADWDSRKPDLHALAQRVADRVRQQSGVDVPTPRVVVRDDAFRTMSELQSQPGIGMAAFRIGQRRISFPQLVLAARQLREEFGGISIQRGVLSTQALSNTEGDRFFIEVLDTRDESSPDDWREIRDRLVEDWRRLRGYEFLLEEEAAYMALANVNGLNVLSNTLSTPATETRPAVMLGVSERVPVRIGDGSFSRSFTNEDEARKQIVQAARAMFTPTTDFETIPESERLLFVRLPSRQAVAVVRIDGFRPVTAERHRMMSLSRIPGDGGAVDSSLRQQLIPPEEQRQRAGSGIFGESFTLEQLYERLDVRLPNGQRPTVGRDDEA